MTKKKIYSLIAILSMSAVVVGAGSTIMTNRVSTVRADDNYTFSFGLLTDSKSIVSGTYQTATTNGNPIEIEYSNIYLETKSSMSCNYISTSGYIAIKGQLGGIKSLKLNKSSEGGNFKIYLGWWDEVNSVINYSTYIQVNMSTTTSSKTFDLSEYSPNYIKIASINGFAFGSADITYTCNASKNPIFDVDGVKLFKRETDCIVLGPSDDRTTLVIPSHYDSLPVTEIVAKAFRSHALTDVTIPGTVETIGSSAFSKCGITSLTLNEGIDGIEYNAFEYNNMTEVNIPDSLRYFGSNCFSYCQNLTTLNISANSELITMGTYAISYTGVTSIFVPKKVYTCDPFVNSLKLETITVDPANTRYSSIDGVMYSEKGTNLFSYPYNKQDETFVMPNTVKTMEHGSFKTPLLKHLTLSNKLESFGTNSSVNGLLDVDFNNAPINQLREYAFSGFAGSTFTVPNTVNTLYWYVLANSKVETINIPATVTSIDATCFNNCSQLTTINYGGTMEQWNAIGKTSFKNCESFTGIVCTDGTVTEFTVA